MARRDVARKFVLKVLRLFFQTVGRLSDGIRICFDYGLTSGKMLDYVYRNKPSGRTFLGRAIDRRFLSSRGWEAIRERRRNLEHLMRESVVELRAAARPVAILDIASGPGAYVFSVVDQVGTEGLTALCRDFDARWVAEGAAEAQRRGLDMIRFETGDAFDRNSLVSLFPRPTLVVASGFYDWITDDDKVRESMGILLDALQPGGYIVTTNQAENPSLEAVHELFTDFRHQPLRMKMRPASQIEDWLRETGFEVQRTVADRDGYYSVTRARKP